jgi:hypothetical protein
VPGAKGSFGCAGTAGVGKHFPKLTGSQTQLIRKKLWMDFACHEPVTCPAFSFSWIAEGVAVKVNVPAIAAGKQRTVKTKVPRKARNAIAKHEPEGVFLDVQGPFGFPLYSIRVRT